MPAVSYSPCPEGWLRGARCGQEEELELQRLAAKTLAHMGTTDEIRDKLLQNPELAELLRERREPDETVDEGALVYLEVRARCPAGGGLRCRVALTGVGCGVAQMLRPRPKSPPRFVD